MNQVLWGQVLWGSKKLYDKGFHLRNEILLCIVHVDPLCVGGGMGGGVPYLTYIHSMNGLISSKS